MGVGPRQAAQGFVHTALGWLYPERCAGCGRFGSVLCQTCRAQMATARGPGRCANCSGAWDGPDFCPRCMHWQALDRCVAAFEMSGPARSLAHLLKYGRVRAAARVMGEDLAPLSSAVAFDVAFAIPLHRSRQRQRGFNQAALLVQAAGWPVGEGMLRPRSTRSQVGLSLSERVANMDGAFHYDGPRLDGLTVAVVDDVVTTGATADACARELKEHGARRVVALAYARTSYLREPPAGT